MKLTQVLGDRKYIRNLGNTTLLALLTIPFMTTEYIFIWYPELNRKLVGVSQNILVGNYSTNGHSILTSPTRQKPDSQQ